MEDLELEYLSIEQEIKRGRKLPIYHIYNKRIKYELGVIKWYGAWRKYCFYPKENTIWDDKCLKDIIDMVNLLNEKHRKLLKNRGDGNE